MGKSFLCPLIAIAAFAASGDVLMPNTATIADIQAAIDAAQPGDKITLADGTYTFDQPLTVNKAITLTGSHRDTCILQGSGTVSFETALIIDNKDACVKNLTVADINSSEWYNYHAAGVRINSGLLTQSRVTGCKAPGGNRTAGVSLEGTSDNAASVTYCQIDHNEATGNSGTGGIRMLNKGGVIANCLIWANQGAGDNGSGGITVMNITAWSLFKIVNCTVVGNSATVSSGGIMVSTANLSMDATIVNCIVANNTAPSGEDFVLGGDAKNIVYNCLCPSIAVGANPQTAAPLFVDAENGDFRLQPASKARNKGDKAKAAAVLGLEGLEGMTDFYGLDRVLEGEVDIGCAEFMVDPDQPTCVISIDKVSVVSGDDVTLTAVVDGFGEAQDIVYAWQIQRAGAEAQAKSGASVLLEDLEFGSYTVNLTASSASLGKSAEAFEIAFLVLPKTLYVTSKENPTAESPYGTPETAATSLQAALAVAVEGATIVLDEGTHNVSETVVVAKGISVVGSGRDKTTLYATAAFEPVVRINGAGAQVSELTIAHGRATTWWTQSAVGVTIGTDGGTLADCRVTDCEAGDAQRVFGAVNLSGSGARVTRCLIDGNTIVTSQSACGGIYATAGVIDSCVITNNVGAKSEAFGTHQGAGLDLAGAVTALNCTIMGNRMKDGDEGAGVHVENSSAVVRNCIIDGNLSGDGTESDYRGNGASFSYCLSSSAAPAGSVECVVGAPVFSTTKPLCLDMDSPGRSKGSAVGYEELLIAATDFFGQPRVKHISSSGAADIDIGAVESAYSGGGIIILFR